MGIIVFTISVICFYIFMMYRIRWVAKTRMAILMKIHDYNRKSINNQNYTDVFDLSDLGDFNAWVYKIWIWDKNKFIKSEHLKEKLWNPKES
jgi:hypothetical protein